MSTRRREFLGPSLTIPVQLVWMSCIERYVIYLLPYCYSSFRPASCHPSTAPTGRPATRAEDAAAGPSTCHPSTAPSRRQATRAAEAAAEATAGPSTCHPSTAPTGRPATLPSQ